MREGARHWQSLESQLRIEAVHDGRGHVTLLFRLRDGPCGDSWDLAVPFTVEAGAEMLALVGTIETFFNIRKSLRRSVDVAHGPH